MLLELRIENLLLIERAELRPGGGLAVITGETGAGKTVLAHALDLLMGGKPRGGIVRPGAREAYVEGVFEPTSELLQDPALADLLERVGPDLDEIVLARRVGADGRTRALVQGRAASVADLRALGGHLIAFFGQHEHRRLTLAAAQLELLDGFGGAAHRELRDGLASAHRRVRELGGALDELKEREGTRDRELDLLRFELEEIESVGPSESEEAGLLAERERLRRLDALVAAAGGGAEAIAPESGESGVGALLAEAERLAGSVAGVDPPLDELAGRLATLRIEADDLGAELRGYASTLEGEPGRLEELEARLDLYDRLRRKHGGSVASVLAHAEECRQKRDVLESVEVELGRTQAALAEAVSERDRLAAELTAARTEAAPRLAERVRAELETLALEGAEFEVLLDPRDEIGAGGAERVELLLAPNPGVPAAPLREAASGGELSRVMLALMTVAGAAESRTIVFDEVDAGVGGQTARAVGERLRALGQLHQVLCITHLPQVAAQAESHFRIEKTLDAEPALTTVEALEGDGVVEELCRMLGAGASDKAARQHARDLLAAA
jgi:DNA repair protein RecN (Recombination protein N)